MEQLELVQEWIPNLSSSFLTSLSVIYTRCVALYLEREEDNEGVENDEVFRRNLVIPLICSILNILTSVVSSSEICDWMLSHDLVGTVAAICGGSEDEAKDFVLAPNREAKKEQLYSVNQITPFVAGMCKVCFGQISKLPDFDTNLAILRFIYSLFFCQVGVYLHLKGEESVDVSDAKERDAQLVGNPMVMKDSGISDLFAKLSEEAFLVLKRDSIEGRRTPSSLKPAIAFLLHTAVVFAKEPVVRLATIIEVKSGMACLRVVRQQTERYDVRGEGSGGGGGGARRTAVHQNSDERQFRGFLRFGVRRVSAVDRGTEGERGVARG